MFVSSHCPDTIPRSGPARRKLLSSAFRSFLIGNQFYMFALPHFLDPNRFPVRWKMLEGSHRSGR